MTRAVILVPRRDDNGHRDRLWRWVRAWWERELPELPVFEGHHTADEGLFNRSAAVNRAAAAATASGPWDVAVIIDSDVIADPATIRAAIARAADAGDRLVLPFTRRHNLNHHGTDYIMAGDRGSWRRYIGRTYTQMVSSVVMVPRALWDKVGGFDEKFSGWGFEDNAFVAACETFGGPLERLEGECWHLWHPAAPEGHRGSPSHEANRARREMYEAARGDHATMRALLSGESPNRLAVRGGEYIPRILHRTVPAITSDEVERWWSEFRQLHPGWELMTHREPLEPAEWPLTGRLWRLCRTGAQKAGLIRLEALYRWGGVYVDSDCEPYRSLEPLLTCHAFAGWEDANAVPDAVLGAEPEHPAIRACLDLALKRLSRGAGGDAEKFTWNTGVGVTTAILPGRSDVVLFPPGTFYPYHYKEKDRRGEDHKRAQPWAFMAHHWAGSWLEKKTA